MQVALGTALPLEATGWQQRSPLGWLRWQPARCWVLRVAVIVLQSRHPSPPPQCPLVAPPTSRPGLGLRKDPGAIPREVLGAPRGEQGQGSGQRPSCTAAPGGQGRTHSRPFAPGPRPFAQAGWGGGCGSPHPAVGLPGGSWAVQAGAPDPRPLPSALWRPPALLTGFCNLQMGPREVWGPD